MNTKTGPDAGNLPTTMEQNRWPTEEVKRGVDQLAAINSVAATVSQSLDLQVTLDTALEAVLGVINVEATGISLVDRKAGELVLRAQRGWKRDFVKMGMRMKLGEGLSGYVIENDELVVTGDVADDSRIIVPAFSEEGVRAMALAPMHAHGEIVGILSAMSYSPYEFSQEELTVLRAVADQVGVALDNARLYEQVAREQSHLRTVVNSSADAVLAIDAGGAVTLANETLCHWFDLESDATLDRHVTEVGLPEALSAGIVEVMERDDANPTTFEVPMDDERVLAFHISPLVNENEQRHGWVTVLHDVTHYKAMEELRSRVMHSAAHDLLNPLHVTEGSLRMLETHIDRVDRDRALSMIDLSLRGIKRMRTLIDDMLQLERIDSGVDIVMVPTNLSAVIQVVVEENRLAAEVKEHTLTVDLPRSLPKVNAEVQLLRRALDNLLNNAIKYTANGGHIEVRARKEGDSVVVEVEDDGRGIPAESHPRLFERYFRVATGEEDEPGTGLGLAIVKSVVDQHNGQVWMRSKVGEGSTFGFSLPIAG